MIEYLFLWIVSITLAYLAGYYDHKRTIPTLWELYKNKKDK